MRLFILAALLLLVPAFSSPKNRGDSEALSYRDKEFAHQLSVRHRKIFCGQFSQAQRDAAIKYARGIGQDKCCTPEEAVLKVMEETGMSLAYKGKYRSTEEHSEAQDK